MNADVFAWPVRIYWEDTDAGGIVYYANYLKFMERARTEFLRSFGVDQSRLAVEQGLAFAIVSANIEYLSPARLDDELVVTCVPTTRTRVSFAFTQEVYRGRVGGELLVRGETRAVCLDCKTFKVQRLPEALIEALGSKVE